MTLLSRSCEDVFIQLLQSGIPPDELYNTVCRQVSFLFLLPVLFCALLFSYTTRKQFSNLISFGISYGNYPFYLSSILCWWICCHGEFITLGFLRSNYCSLLFDSLSAAKQNITYVEVASVRDWFKLSF